MKKNDLLLNLLLLALVTGLFSCSKEKQVKNEFNLKTKMISIENDALTRDYNYSIFSREIVNTAYFNKVLEIKQLKNKDARNALIIELSSYQLATNKFSAIKQGGFGVTLSEDETIILQSFIRVIQDSNESTIAVADFFINEIACLNINDDVKMTCINKLTFYKDFLLYINADTSENMTLNISNDKEGQNASKTEWHCPYRDCFDCCMLSKSNDLEEGNWVDLAQFLVCPPCEVGWWIASCGYDCVTQN